MKHLLLGTTMLCLAIGPAHAVTVTIGYELTSDPNSVGIVQAAQAISPSNGTLTASFAPTTSYGVTWTTDVNATAGSTTDFSSNVGVINSLGTLASDSIGIFVTLSDITAPTGLVDFVNTMTIEPPIPAGWTLNRTVYFNPDNLIFGQENYLVSPTLYSTPGTVTFDTMHTTGPSPYSITQFYGFQAEPSSLPVPGPIVGAGLPGLLAGVGALTLLARRRRRQS